jgi:hypothetical protein
VINVDDPGAGEVTARVRGSRPDLRVGTAPGAGWHITAITYTGMSSTTTVSAPDGQQVCVQALPRNRIWV